MSDERAFPDISFVDSDALAILSEMIAGYEAETGRTLYPADPVRVLLNYVAAVISQERAKINDSAKMNVPRFARGGLSGFPCRNIPRRYNVYRQRSV